jgi:formylmethanofuran dehydrogenase subunit C
MSDYAYVYINTNSNSTAGIYVSGGYMQAKNNLVQNVSSYAYRAEACGSWTSDITNNLSSQSDTPGSNPQNSKTVSFVNATGNDFHLAGGDIAAGNAGVNLLA